MSVLSIRLVPRAMPPPSRFVAVCGLAALSAASAAGSRALQTEPTQCPDPTTRGCGMPAWDVRWSMRASLYTYCYESCPLEFFANHSDLGLFGGVVGVDHYWTGQGMPCIDGVPQEFAAQDAFAAATKARFPGTKMLLYRITDAVPYAAVVHDAMVEHPDWFARWTHPPYDNGTLCLMPPEAKTGRPGDNCSWEIRAGVYDFSQEVVRDWFLENIVKPVMKVGDGIWLDGDGPDNGAWACSGSYDWKNLKPPYPALNSSETDAFCVGENLVQQAAHEWLIANGGFDAQACFSNIAGSSLPQAADTPAQCAAKLRASDHRPSPLGGPTGYAMDRTGGRDYTDATALQTIAAFMLVRDAHWFFGVTQTSNTINMTVAALLLSDFGAPLDRMSNAGDVFTRHYEKATVTLDCASFTARFTPV